MIKIIDGKRYNTGKALKVFSHWNGYTTLDFHYRTWVLYLTQAGAWFLHHKGGALSDMSASYGNALGGSESIEPVTEAEAFEFLQEHSDDDEALEAIDKYFGHLVQEA